MSMAQVLNWGIGVILWLQHFSPALDAPFKLLSYLGTEDFLLLAFPLVYWCFSRQFGVRLTALFLVSTYTVSYIKVAVNEPRPFTVDSRIKMLDSVNDAAFPSGHTQGAVVVWGYLATAFKRRWLTILAIALIVFIPLSRMYLGVHYPTDLAGGYVIGGLFLLACLYFIEPIEAWLSKKGMWWQIGLTVLVTLLLLLVFPTYDDNGITEAALIFSGGIGVALERRFVRFSIKGTPASLLLRLLIGLAVLMALRFGLKAAFAPLGAELTFRFIRYTLMGMWFLVGAPWVFLKLKLVERE
jgi:membrane-associated phospholipid phosphatase